MSLDLWINDVKMSPNKDKSVPQLVEKYKRDKQTRDLDRDLMRRLIRREHPELFLDNPSNLKKLDRYLREAFDNPKNQTEEINNNDNSGNIKKNMGLFSWLEQRADRKKKEHVLKNKRLECELAILYEKIELETEGELNEDDPEYLRKLDALRLKKQKEYGLL